MERDDQQAKGRGHLQREMDQTGEHNHRDPDHKYDLEEEKESEIQIEESAQPDNRDFQND